MLVALLSTIMAAFSDVFWKRSLNFGVRSWAHELSSYLIPLSLLVYFFITGFQISEITVGIILLVLLVITIDNIRLPIYQQVYREEKISVVTPYLNISKVLVIVSSFFIFNDVSHTTLYITLFAIFILSIFSINFKTLKFPRCFGKILFTECLKAASILIDGWLIIKYGGILYFNVYIALGFILSFGLSLYSKQLSDLKNANLRYWKERYLGSLGWLSWFLSIMVISSLGLSISILLGFIGVGVTLLFSYIFLRDLPSKKDITLTIVVAILIGIGYYFK